MAERNVGNTALGAATCRLIEQYQPESTRLLVDPVVKELVGGPIRLLMQFAGLRKFTIKQTDAVAEGIYGGQICRTRYIDDTVQEAISKGTRQVVILGAGFDTRPYRLPKMVNVSVFEVDLPSVQNDKKQKLQKYLGRLPENVTYLPIDFDTQTLEEVFAGASFDSSRPAVFIWEGVTQYISKESVRQTLAFIGRSALGSTLLFTYVLKSVIERRSDIPGANHMMDQVEKNGIPFIFGLEPSEIPGFLKPYHLTLVADVGNAFYQEKYIQPVGRELVVSEAERIAHVVVE
jgi:methyltransferase (TIGR00027 family)